MKQNHSIAPTSPHEQTEHGLTHIEKQTVRQTVMTRRDFMKHSLAAGLAGSVLPQLGLTQNKDSNKRRRELSERMIFLNEQDTYRTSTAGEMTITGDIPEELTGALFRNGPGIKDFYGELQEHLFDGHGVISAFYFDRGSIRHKSRVTETARYEMEASKKHLMYMLFGTPVKQAGDYPVRSSWELNQANINAVVINKNLWALNEATGFYKLDPEELSVIGRGFDNEEYNDLPFGPHPRFEPVRGKIFNATYMVSQMGFIVTRLDANGAVENFNVVSLEKSPMIHDSILTDRYFIVLTPPYATQGGLRLDGEIGKNFQSTPDEPTKIYVFDKNNLANVRIFETHSQFIFHFDNAYEDGEKIITHFPSYPDGDAVVGKAFRKLEADNFYPREEAPPQYNTLELNVRTGEVRQEVMSEWAVEFPRINEHFSLKKNNWTALVGNTIAKRSSLHDLIYINNVTGKSEVYRYGEKTLIEEHIIHPKKNNTAERAAWLMGMSHNLATQRSSLNIFDGESNISNGPMASIELPYLQHFCFHGNYYDRSLYT